MAQMKTAMKAVKVAALQASFAGTPQANTEKTFALAARAAEGGADVVLPPELFERPYFCKTQRAEFLQYAAAAADNAAVRAGQELAARAGIVLPVSFYERANNALFNSIAMIDADGKLLGVYRKSHIPDGAGYQEKFYFSPGDTGFRVWQTKHGKIGVGICWDQWFPEAARAMALQGADLLLYPTAIGSEPQSPDYDSSAHWQIAMRGHAAANIIPLAAANRVGTEEQTDAFGNKTQLHFYGQSFIANEYGEMVTAAGDEDDKILTAEFDFADIAARRLAWGVYRDRRPELYTPLMKMDGKMDGVL